MCSLEDILMTARALESVKGLTITERLMFCMAPITTDDAVQAAALEMAEILASSRDGSVLNMQTFDLEILDIENPTLPEELRALESLHKSLLLYLWLSWRFPATFTPRETAQELKVICECLIDTALKNIKMPRLKHVLDEPFNEETVVEDEMEEDEDAIMDREEEGESVVPHISGEVVPLTDGEMGMEPKEWVVGRSATI
ncbi:uncharacterized protein LAJ45_03107 [Morchella importuna]|uniref:uncharacterized protein n=1 Tax=Morchella importuna TaxID=1174673 RepID=UPI001E8D9398|nr:uncharacterized protein LAJ45_03107 [Morchella importuna]KAH8152881.1 hypothetical protein LAJ45_03107 [Morchella importuna]